MKRGIINTFILWKPCLAFLMLNFFFITLALRPVQAQKITFNQVTTPEVTSFGVVTQIIQDTQGYIWLSTNKGLYKYDGYKLTNFKNDPINPKSLASNHAECLFSDANGIIWIGTLGAGMDHFNTTTNTFTHFRYNKNKVGSLSNDTVTVIMKDSRGTMWIGTHGGLNRWDPNNKRFISYKSNPNDPSSISNNQIRAIYEDREGTLWVGTGSAFPSDGGLPHEGGLNRFDRKSGKFTRYLHDPNNPKSLFNNKIRAIYEDSRGTFWVGTKSDGLHTMDRKKGTFTRYRYDPKNPEKLSRPYLRGGQIYEGGISFIQEDASGAIWIGAWIGGLNRYDPITKKVTHYEASDTSKQSYNDDGAWCAFTSREGVFWIGTNGGNLYTIDPFKKNISHYPAPQGTRVVSFAEDSLGTLWIGTENGLFKKNPRKGISHLMKDETFPSLSNSPIYDITEDKQGKLWIGTGGAGLKVYNQAQKTVVDYKHNPGNVRSLSSNMVTRVYQDYEGTIWVGTFHGLNKLDQKNKAFVRYVFNKDTASISPNTVTSIFKDKQHQVWIGTWINGGIQKLDEKSGRLKSYLNGTSVMSIYKDTRGTLWVGGDDGLFHYYPSSDTFIKFSDPSSPNAISNVGNIMEDGQNNLWFTSNLGIVKLKLTNNETSIYGRYFGIAIDDVDYFSGFKGRDGRFYLSDSSGYYSYLPTKLLENVKAPIISFQNFRIGDQDVKVSRSGILTEPLSSTKEIRLKYDQDVFSFDFAVLDYINPKDNRYVFKLENFDDTWRRANAEGRAYYFNVPAGKYLFRVKGANSNGIWGERTIGIIISPPWWRTWWAYLVFIVAAITIIWGFIYYRSRSLIKEKRVLEEKVSKRTAEVVKQKEEIAKQRDHLEQALLDLRNAQNQLIQSEKMASLGELTAGIAHEIQNPLNFVNNFSEVSAELIDDMEKELEEGDNEDAKIISAGLKENLKKILSHGKRADAIVKGMLQHSRNSTGIKELTDINSLADEYLRLSYFGLRAKDKSFSAVIETDLDAAIDKINIIPQDIGRVLLNLLNNAFYSVSEKKSQKGENYKPIVSLSTKSLGDKVEIRIKDNGVGMSKRLLDKIYEPFFTTKPSGHGTGLGLSLSYEIITKGHGGELEVETIEGEFAEFIIRLPV